MHGLASGAVSYGTGTGQYSTRPRSCDGALAYRRGVRRVRMTEAMHAMTRRTRVRAVVALVAAIMALAGPAVAQECMPGTAPYAGFAGAALVPEVRTSNDADPVRYVRWRGTVPSF